MDLEIINKKFFHQQSMKNSTSIIADDKTVKI